MVFGVHLFLKLLLQELPIDLAFETGTRLKFVMLKVVVLAAQTEIVVAKQQKAPRARSELLAFPVGAVVVAFEFVLVPRLTRNGDPKFVMPVVAPPFLQCGNDPWINFVAFEIGFGFQGQLLGDGGKPAFFDLLLGGTNGFVLVAAFEFLEQSLGGATA